MHLVGYEAEGYLDYKFHVVLRGASVAVAYHVFYLQLRRLPDVYIGAQIIRHYCKEHAQNSEIV